MVTMEPTSGKKIYTTLRIAMAMCLIGHGAFGVITKSVWCNYFAVFGIGSDLAYRMMPVVGMADIITGLLILCYPLRAGVWWLMIWGAVTALLRPLSGEPLAEFPERAGNYGAPLAMLILTGWHSRKWLTPVEPPAALDEVRLRKLTLCLQLVVCSLLAGHGWLNCTGKQALLAQYGDLGFASPARAAMVVGSCEIAAAVAVLLRPARVLLLALFIWKIGSELFYPHHAVFEWIERGGSYGSILALYLARGLRTHAGQSFRWRTALTLRNDRSLAAVKKATTET